jgi:PAS domain S-box-containing protein
VVKEQYRNQLIFNLSKALILNNPDALREEIALSLSYLGGVFSAHRTLIILGDNTHQKYSIAAEWHKPGFRSLSSAFQSINPRDYMIWGKFRSNNTFLHIGDTNNLPDSYPFDSKLFREADCKAYYQKALISANQQIGFISILLDEVDYMQDNSLKEYLDVVGELYLILFSKITSLTASPVSKSKVNPVQSFQSSIKKGNEYLHFLAKVFGDLNYGIAIYDTSLQKFIFSNKRCIDLFGIHTSEIQSNDIFRVFKENGYNPSDFFSSDGQQRIKDFSLSNLNQYLTGSVNPVSDTHWVIMSVQDITPIANYEKAEKSFNQQLKMISEVAIELISQGREQDDIYAFIGEKAYTMLGNAIVVVNKYHQKGGYLKSVYVNGFGFSMELITKLIGKHPLNKTYPLDIKSEAYQRITSARINEITGGIAELSLGAIAEPIGKKIEKITNLKRLFVCGLFADNKLYGTINFLMRPDTEINFYILETFSRMASNALRSFDIKQKLAKTTKVLADAVNIAKVGYWEYDFNTSTFLINSRLYALIEPGKLSAESEDNEVNIKLDEFLSRYTLADDASRIKNLLNKVAKNRNKENYVADLEFKLILPSGSFIHVYTRGIIQNQGRLMGVTQDISEIKNVEKNLWESELKFQNLVEQSLDAIVVVKDDGTITEWNPRAEEITGIKSENAMGRYAWEIESAIIFNPEIRKTHPQQPESKLKTRFFKFFHSNLSRKPFNSEIIIRNTQGEIKHLSITSFVFTANQRKFLCRISKDITLEKQKQEREKDLEIKRKTAKAKDLFLDNMSHEMRTPLSGIIGMTDILLHSRMNSQQNEMLKVVKESSDSLLELITSIHELSRLEDDGIIIQQKPFRIGILLEKTLSIFKASALQKSIELVITDNSPANIRVIGDEFRLRQVLGNLVGNALKFTPPGGKVEAVVNASRLNSKTMEFLFEIKDTGIGIEQDKIPILFQKFSQVDNSYTREYEGVGIGLSISRELVKLMGGDIGVNSEHRRGSVFWVRCSLSFQEA